MEYAIGTDFQEEVGDTCRPSIRSMEIGFSRLSIASLGVFASPYFTIVGIGCGAMPSLLAIPLEIIVGLGLIGFEGGESRQLRTTLHAIGFLTVILLCVLTLALRSKPMKKGLLAAQTLMQALTWWDYVDSIENATHTRPGDVAGSPIVWVAIAFALIVMVIPTGRIQVPITEETGTRQ